MIVLMLKEQNKAVVYIQRNKTSTETYDTVPLITQATDFQNKFAAMEFARTCIGHKKQKNICLYDSDTFDAISFDDYFENNEHITPAPEHNEQDIDQEEIVEDNDIEPVREIKPDTIKVVPSALKNKQNAYDIGYDNSVFIEKTLAFMNAYLEFAEELKSHNDVEKQLRHTDQEFMDCRHIIEFAALSSTSAFHMLNLEKKILLKRRAYKDTIRILDALKSFQRVTTVANANAVIDAITNLDERHYGLRTKEFADILN
jgi:hypothetical protein